MNILRDMSAGNTSQAKLSELVTKQKIILKQALQCEYRYIVMQYECSGLWSPAYENVCFYSLPRDAL